MNENQLNGCLSNSEDTLNRDINQFKELDSLLKCGICYDYFDTCVITDCSHNFCSLCIRKYIQYKTECPVCFHRLYDSQLRANRIIDNFISIFPNLKDRLICELRALKTLKSNGVYVSPSKDLGCRTPVKSNTSSKEIQEVSLNKDKNIDTFTKSTEVAQNVDRTSVLNKVVIPKMFQSPVKRNSSTLQHSKRAFVSCPVCQVEIPERNINLHLDDCLNRDKDEKRKKEPECSIKRKQLPKFVYSLMSINELRSKLKEHALNSYGDFETLKTRLQKYTALYNAECDKTNPRPIQDVIHQLEREEKALSTQKSSKSIFTIFRDDNVPREKQNEQYLKENKVTFQTLVHDVRKRDKKIDRENGSTPEGDFAKKTPTINWNCEPSTSKMNYEDPTAHCKKNHQPSINSEDIDFEEIKIEPCYEFKSEPIGEPFDETNDNALQDTAVDPISPLPSRRSKRNLFGNISTRKKLYDFDAESDSKNSASSEDEHHKPSKAKRDENELYDSNFGETSPVIHKRNSKKRRCNEEEITRSPSRRKKK